MTLPESYLSLTKIERAYVDGRLDGLSQIAAATAAGASTPRTAANRLEKNEKVQQALVDRMQQTADEVDFGRKEAHQMYMDAYQNADTAMEQIAAVNAMVKLHGLEKPKLVEIKHDHTHSGKIEHMTTDELMKLAGMDKALALEGEFSEVEPKPLLEPPTVTEDNTIESKELPNLREGY